MPKAHMQVTEYRSRDSGSSEEREQARQELVLVSCRDQRAEHLEILLNVPAACSSSPLYPQPPVPQAPSSGRGPESEGSGRPLVSNFLSLNAQSAIQH